MKRRIRPPSEELLREAIDDEGLYDAARLARLLHWEKQEIAAFLKKNPSALSRQTTSRTGQQALARLAATFRHLLDVTNNDIAQARAWLYTPIQALDGRSPKELMLSGDLEIVANLLDEIESGFAA